MDSPISYGVCFGPLARASKLDILTPEIYTRHCRGREPTSDFVEPIQFRFVSELCRGLSKVLRMFYNRFREFGEMFCTWALAQVEVNRQVVCIVAMGLIW